MVFDEDDVISSTKLNIIAATVCGINVLIQMFLGGGGGAGFVVVDVGEDNGSSSL